MKKPRIFISSTISDFRDLRSAMKFYLEKFGYKVLLSEFNDFEKPLDTSTINACIQAIETSAIYILLIGGKSGGLFSKKEKISITRFEYRNAYELFLQGKIRLVLFAREEIWKLKDDREALLDLLDSSFAPFISKQKKLRLKHHDSPTVINAELIFSFIDEVARVEEFEIASGGEAEFPRGNWVHSFSTFEDIINVLDVELKIKQDIGKISRKLNLKRDLAKNYNQNINRYSANRHFCNFWYVSSTKRILPESMPRFVVLPRREVLRLCEFTLYSQVGNEFSKQFIDQAIESGDYLFYDKEKREFKASEIHKSLLELKSQIDTAKHFSTNCSEWITEFYVTYHPLVAIQQEVSIDMKLLVFILGLANAMENIFFLSKYIYFALNGNLTFLQEYRVQPISPFLDQIKQIKKERFELLEIIDFLESSIQ